MVQSQFKFKNQLRVRNYEVDWQGIVHNANYLLYFEVGRLEYLKHLGVKLDFDSIQKESRVVLVRNEVNYRSPARFDDSIDIYTRISSIKNTSFVFEGMIMDSPSGRLIADNVAIHVWIHPQRNDPMTVPENFRRIVGEFEGASVRI